MSRRQRAARGSAHRTKVAREKVLRRRARSRKAAAAAAAAVTLAGAAGAAPPAAADTVATTGPATRSALLDCSGATTPDSDPANLTDVDGTLFFTADAGVKGNGLWRSDGTAGGTVLLKKLAGSDYGYEYEYDGRRSPERGSDVGGYIDSSLIGVGSTLFFTTESDRGEELWRSDGTKAGTVLVRRFGEVGGYSYDEGPSDMTAVGDTLFFTADDGTHGTELWRSDGTRAGTVMVKDIQPAAGSDYYGYGPGELTAVGDTVYFTADDGTHGAELWRSDGTRAGTVLVKDVRPGAYSSTTSRLTAVGDVLYFRARDGVHGRELWRTDGTTGGTTLVENIRPGGDGSNPDDLVAVGDTLFFSAEDGTSGRDLWRSDGTEAGTLLVKDLAANEEYYGADNLVAVGDTLFFAAADDAHGQELWRSDGTEAGTVLVKDIRPGDYHGYPTELTEVAGTLFFTARDGVHGPELWRSDGTEAGTVMVKDTHPTTGGRPRSLTESDGALYFRADDGTHGEELWRSDGTSAGTAMVTDINLGGAFEVSSRAELDRDDGTVRVRVVVDGAGTVVAASAGKRRVKRTAREFGPSDSTRATLVLKLTRAARRELRREGRLRLGVQFTFTSCGGGASSETRHYTLRMR